MTKILIVFFCISIVMPIYTYVLYPVILFVFKKKQYIVDDEYCPKVSVIIAAYNEEKEIANRIVNLTKLDYPQDKLEFLVGSDGSTDRTNEIVSKMVSDIDNLKFFVCERGGKVSVLNTLLENATGEIVVFSDANTEFDSLCIKNIVRNFTDKRIGCVSGQVRLKVDINSGEGAVSEGIYWRYENIVKKLESRIGRLSGANGPVYAIRKELCSKIKKGVINDDFYVSTYVLQSGYDVIMDVNAVAFEKPNDDFKSQFKRHIRDGAGHYQAMTIFKRMLLPRKGSFVYVSHRVIKWLVPFCLIVLLVTNAILSFKYIFFKYLFIVHLAMYFVLILYGFILMKLRNNKNILTRLIGIIYYFISVNLALFIGFIKYITGKQGAVWETQREDV